MNTAFTVSGSGPPLYMIHGIGSRKTTWASLTEHLADAFTCIAYDLRGHGGSDVFPTPYTLDDLVEDLEGLRDTLGDEQIHIIGHSLGGMIGPAYARRYPEHTASVTLLSTAAGRTEEDRSKLFAVIQRLKDEGIANVMPTLVDRWYTEEFVANRPDAIEKRIKEVNDTPAEVFLSVFDIYADTEMAPWLHEVVAPCLIITGEHDRGCSPRHNEFIHGELSNSELVILDDLRHSILVEASDQVAPIVGAFLARQA